jgi:ribose transport system ATP-binding protein
MGFLPGDRKVHGGVMVWSARHNLTLPSLRPVWRRGWLRNRIEKREARDWFSRLRVMPAGVVDAPLSTYSGGNQQKILFAKWLRLRPSVLLLDEPTQGVDVGAKAELHRQLLGLAAGGTALVISSTDIEELVALCDRVIVLRLGTVAAELWQPEIDSESIVMLTTVSA